MKTEKIVNIFLISLVSLVLIVILLYGFGILQTFFQAEPGFKSYGESGSAITGLNLVSETLTTWGGAGIGWGGSSPPAPGESVQYSSLRGSPELHIQSGGYNERVYSSAFWDIISVRWSPEQTGLTPSGDDFDLILTSTPGTTGYLFYHDLLSKETFGKGRVFRTELIVDHPQTILIKFLNPPQNILSPKVEVASGISLSGLTLQSHLLEIRSSPVTDTVNIYLDGQLYASKTISSDYKLGFSSTGLRLRNTAYKDVFNCQVDPNEQYYYAIFKRPDTSTVSKAQLENFHKWCSDFPAEIWTNSGAITDETINPALEGVLDNPPQTFTLPVGQIWGVTYIGEKKSLTTPCELNELLVNGDTCTAKTVLEIDLICQAGGNCAGGEPQQNVSVDSLIIETEAVDYILSNLQTHQFLANNSKIRFTHYKDDFSSSSSSFNLFGKTFLSNGVTSQFGATPKTSSFSYGTNVGDIAIGDIQVLDEFNKVALTRVELQDPITVGIGNIPAFVSEWTFEVDTSFLVLSYDEQTKEIIVTNNYYLVVGGMSLIKENNLGQQTSQDVQKSFPLGTTRISIGDTTGLVKVAGRPYFNIETPDSNYKLSGSSAITISDLEEAQVIVNIADEPATPPIQLANIQGGNQTTKPKIKISTGLIVGIVGGLIVGTLVFFIIKGLRRPRIKRRR